jgi:hypothetical protein
MIEPTHASSAEQLTFRMTAADARRFKARIAPFVAVEAPGAVRSDSTVFTAGTGLMPLKAAVGEYRCHRQFTIRQLIGAFSSQW